MTAVLQRNASRMWWAEEAEYLSVFSPQLRLAIEETSKQIWSQSVTLAKHNGLISGHLPSLVFIPFKHAWRNSWLYASAKTGNYTQFPLCYAKPFKQQLLSDDNFCSLMSMKPCILGQDSIRWGGSQNSFFPHPFSPACYFLAEEEVTFSQSWLTQNRVGNIFPEKIPRKLE